jgi:hypothetical protein
MPSANPAKIKNTIPPSTGTHSGSQQGGFVPVDPPPVGGGPADGCVNAIISVAINKIAINILVVVILQFMSLQIVGLKY